MYVDQVRDFGKRREAAVAGLEWDGGVGMDSARDGWGWRVVGGRGDGLRG